MIRFFKELFNPKLKCKRVGHTFYSFRRKVHYSKMRLTKEERIKCDRCGEVKEDWKEYNYTDYTSVTWPSSLCDELEDNGIVIDRDEHKHKLYVRKD